MNPLIDDLIPDLPMTGSMFDTLAFRLPDNSIVPGLADSWTEDDPTTWTLKLHQGVTFWNGEPFNANTVKFWVDKVATPGYQLFAYLGVMKSADVIDNYTIRLHTTKPRGNFPSVLAQFYMLPSQYFQQVGQDGFVKAPIGTGPYKFVEWVKDSHLTLEANTNYWNKLRQPTFQRVTFRFIPDRAALVAALLAGQLDLAVGVPADNYQQVTSAPGLAGIAQRSLRTVFLRFNAPANGGAPLKDVQVRKAINFGIDVQTIDQALMGGKAFIVATSMSPDLKGYDPSIQPYGYHPDQAKQLLAQAGYPNGFAMDIDVWTDGTPENSVQVVQAIASQLAKIGITLNIKASPSATLFQRDDQHNLDAIQLWSWGASQVDCRDKFWGLFNKASVDSYMTDDLLDTTETQLDSTFDPTQRDVLCKELQQHSYDQAFIAPLFMLPVYYGLKTDIKWVPRSDEMYYPWEMTVAPTQ